MIKDKENGKVIVLLKSDQKTVLNYIKLVNIIYINKLSIKI